jgi:hypothetical protein
LPSLGESPNSLATPTQKIFDYLMLQRLLVMSGVDLPTVKEILGHREIEVTLRYSHLAPAHKAKAVEKLGEVLEKITNPKEREAARDAEGDKAPALAANLAQIRNVFLVRSGRGLSVIGPKEPANQAVNRSGEWWGGGNCTY